MTSRLSRLMKQTGPNPLFSRGRKPRLLPMSKEDERINAELHRRREAKRKVKEDLQ